MYRADFIAEVVPGLVLVAATYIAAVPAFRTVRQSSRGRARLAMAWLSGFLFGLVATTLLSVAIEEAADPDASVAGFGLLGAFLGPFQSVERRLARELPAWLVQHRGECRIVARLVMIEQVLIAER